MMRRIPAVLGWLVLSLCLAAYVIALVMFSATAGVPAVPPQVIAFVAFPLVGALIVTRRPRSTVGWLFCAIGLGTSITSFSGAYVTHALAIHADTQLAVGLIDALGNIVWPLNLGLGSLLVFLFPDGRLPSRRWRLLYWLDVAVVVAVSLSAGLVPGPLESGGRAVNPIGIPGAAPLLGAVTSIGQLVFVSLVAAAVLSAIVRYLHASGMQRLQIKWFAYGAALLVLIVIATTILATALTPRGQDPSNSLISAVGFSLGLLMLPLGAGIGVLRYRLYDIDILINRTLVYGSLSAVLAAVYFACVIGAQGVLQARTGETRTPPVVIVASTLLIAALFNPLRRRFQSFIDRRFYRRKYDAAKTLASFGTALRTETDLTHLTQHLVSAVNETMQPQYVSLWLSGPPRGQSAPGSGVANGMRPNVGASR